MSRVVARRAIITSTIIHSYSSSVAAIFRAV
jgi:hypothetical protein